MFVKQPNRLLQQLLAVENKTILQQPKPSTFWIRFNVTLIFSSTSHWHASRNICTNGSFEVSQERMFVRQRRTHYRSTYLLSKKTIYAQAKIIKSLHHRFKLSKKFSEWLFIHITLETVPNEMQCDETIGCMVTAGRFYFCTLRNACLTAGKTTMTAGKTYNGCFEMLSWPHRTSANIMNMSFWLLETCTECL